LCHGTYRAVDVEDWIIHADNDEFHYYGVGRCRLTLGNLSGKRLDLSA
jgi:hypothetical protein